MGRRRSKTNRKRGRAKLRIDLIGLRSERGASKAEKHRQPTKGGMEKNKRGGLVTKRGRKDVNENLDQSTGVVRERQREIATLIERQKHKKERVQSNARGKGIELKRSSPQNADARMWLEEKLRKKSHYYSGIDQTGFRKKP